MARNVLIIIRQSPFDNIICSEALRMCVGLTLADNKITVIFLDDGVFLLTPMLTESKDHSDIRRYLETLKEFDCRLIAEKKALKETESVEGVIDFDVSTEMEISKMITESDRVIVF
jgi:sulfur relay (sulfurtransferase) DsrF/TusC family protein